MATQLRPKLKVVWIGILVVSMLILFGHHPRNLNDLFHPSDLKLFWRNSVGLAVLVGLTFLFAGLLTRQKRWNVSPLIGEMLAGFILGPSLLGWVAPGLLAEQQALGELSHTIGWVGVLLMVQESGFGVDPKQVRRTGWGVTVLGITCVAVPFGSSLIFATTSDFIRSQLTGTIGLLFFALVISTSGLVEALRVLRESGPLHADVRNTLLPAYAMNEVLGFAPLAILLAFTGTGSNGLGSSMMKIVIGMGLGILAVQFSPLTRRWFGRHESRFLWVNLLRPIIGVACGLISDFLGLTALLGFFISGILTGTDYERDNASSPASTMSPYRFATKALVPIYFASIGLGLNVRANFDFGLVFVIVPLAILLRYGGALLGARLRPNRFGIAEQRLLGLLFTPAGVTGLVIAQVGLSLGYFSEAIFTALVISVPISVALLPSRVARVMQELKDVLPLSDLALSRYIPRHGVISFKPPRKLDVIETDVEYYRRTIWILGQAFEKQTNLDVNFQIVAEEIVGNVEKAPLVQPFGNGIIFAHARVKGLEEPMVLFARLTAEMPVQTPDLIEPRLIILTLSMEGDDGPQRFGQQFWVNSQLGHALRGGPENIAHLTEAKDEASLYLATQSVFNRAF